MPDRAVPDHPLPHPDLTDFVLGSLGERQADAFAAHLAGCGHCRAEVAELAPLREVLDEVLPADGGVPAGVEARTLAAVGQEAAGGAPGGRARRARPLAAAASSAVAGALLALGVAGGLAGDDGPGGREIALVPADGGAASGTATLARSEAGIVVELDLAGLAVPPAGSYYECWYVAGGDAPGRPDRVSAGTFTLPADGRVTARMLTAADPRRYPGIEVTLEPADGDPAATGPVVLRSAPRTPRSTG